MQSQTESEILEHNLLLAKQYYHDAPEAIWTSPVVLDIIVSQGLLCREGLMNTEADGYKFKYRGIQFRRADCCLM